MRSGDPEQSASACSPTSRHSSPASKSFPAVALFLAIVLAGLAGDLLSKHHVFSDLMSDPALPQQVEGMRMHYGRLPLPPERALAELRLHRQVFPGVRFTLSTNPGVVFGTPMPWIVVAAVTLIGVVAMAIYFAMSPAAARWTHVALALVIAGALGNLYDRLFAQVALPGMEPIRHQVRDFLDCSQIGYKWIFNVADAYVVAGVAMMVLHWLLDGRRAAKDRRAERRMPVGPPRDGQ